MIDDDFDKVVRHMFERFFNNAFGPDMNGAGMVKFRLPPSIAQDELDIDLPRDKEVQVEKIDLGDSLLVILERYSDIDRINVEVIDKTIVVDNGIEKKYIEIPFLADIKESGYSLRNGILEIRLMKMDSESIGTTINSGILEIES